MFKTSDFCLWRKGTAYLFCAGFARDFGKAFADMHIPKDPPLNSVDPRLTENVGVYPHLANDFSRFLDCWFSHLAVEVPGEGTSNEWCEPVSEETYKELR